MCFHLRRNLTYLSILPAVSLLSGADTASWLSKCLLNSMGPDLLFSSVPLSIHRIRGRLASELLDN